MDLPLPQEIARMDGERLRRYRTNLEFYHGRQWTGPPRRRERRLTFNYARAVVDKTTSYLMTGLDFAVDPPEPGAEGEALARRTEAGTGSAHMARPIRASSSPLPTRSRGFSRNISTAVAGFSPSSRPHLRARLSIRFSTASARLASTGVPTRALCHSAILARLRSASLKLAKAGLIW